VDCNCDSLLGEDSRQGAGHLAVQHPHSHHIGLLGHSDMAAHSYGGHMRAVPITCRIMHAAGISTAVLKASSG
jgi:hypothetical protein